KTVLSAIDTKKYNFYSNLKSEEQKQYTGFVLMRFMSSAPDQGGLHAYFVEAVNQIVNTDFWTTNAKHPELIHKLLCMTGLGNKHYHQWIAGPKRPAGDKVSAIFKKIYPGINVYELKMLYNMYSID